ncbi:molybdopterin-guanine dinucleotide biosynthesis protein B [Salinicoccus albus]|uniref:molybdopterin-guanine dinucleotide biosynthesis protein B n=1 Tax=Salinicoccus albus TaxID=418756 RepID=UPI00037548C5|nr:molybdopterin-guanine dinucleotide biosynthesis protein B [Salinicoccus albus]
MKVLQVTGYKNAGKTAVIERMVRQLKERGKTAAVIKHHHLDTAVFGNSTDSGRFTSAGADHSILNTPGMTMETIREPPDLKRQLQHLEQQGVEFVLIEGYKNDDYQKIFLRYSSAEGHTNVEEIGLSNVLKTFDIRYDEERIMEWFKEWSFGDETI